MNLLKNLPFGKKKQADAASERNQGPDSDLGEFDQPIGESVMESQAVMESESFFAELEERNRREDAGERHDGMDESVAGSSADMSAESIIGTRGNEEFIDVDPVVEPKGIGAKLKSMFGGKKSKKQFADSMPADNAGHQEDEDDNALAGLLFSSQTSDADSSGSPMMDLDDGQPSELSDSVMMMGSEEGAGDSPFVDDETPADRRMREIVSDIGARPNPLPIIGALPSKRQYSLALTVMTASLLAAGYLSITGLISQGFYKERANVGTRVQLASQNTLLTTQNLVIRADEGSFAQLQEDKALLEQARSLLASDADNSIAQEGVKVINTQILPIIERVLAIGGELGSLNAQAGALDRGASDLYLLSDQLASYLQANSSSSLHIAAANDLRVRAERMSRNGAKILTSNAVTLEPLARFSNDLRELNVTLGTLTNGVSEISMNPMVDATALSLIGEIRIAAGSINNVASFMQRNATALINARLEVTRLRDFVQEAEEAAGRYTTSVIASSDGLQGRLLTALVLLGAAIAALMLLGLINNRLTRLEAWETAFKNKSSEKDIIGFMKEIFPLEQGDLTVGFTGNTAAMEGVTGGMRSSVTEAVGSLRDAMSTVKSTTDSVMTNVNDSVESSRDLQNSNDRQVQEIGDVVNRVAGLTSAIGRVTQDTIRAAEMTNSARSASEAGARRVAETNEKMTEIRSSMQDVLKSVKHLGETSHEIGTIVEAIETITDRTQVIAVNASLEAAKAGAAGQGFQVLAGEVNRLAEQSNEALRTITALVQRIQGETASTIRTVEESTNSVVEGARLSETANTELVKISTISGDLQAIMVQIREQSESQTSSASSVRESMDRLDELSKDNQTSVNRMVAGVQQIDASMGTLQSTVSIFKTEAEAA